LHRIALVTARAALGLDEDMPLLADGLRRAGFAVETPCWDDEDVDWSRFDLALLRSTWDYVERIDEFLDWARGCAQRTRLANAPEVVEWNTDKHYLATLHAAGVAVVPTRFVEPGADALTALDAFLRDDARAFDVGEPHGPVDEFVVKPSIGAGSRDAARYRRADREAALSHLVRLVEVERRSALLQPYLQSVDAQGETALIYIGAEPSHAIRKGPLLRVGDGLVAGLFAPEEITPREPSGEERRLAAAAHAAIPFRPAPLYARIDMIHDARGAPVVLELELTEPSLFFAHAPGSEDRFARLLREELRLA
jgi:glutathione synthase/RimK-type ligase-like ATP-grasp enzyme